VPIGSGKATWFWGVGSGAYWVAETAQVDYQVLEDPGPIIVDSGTRTETMSRIRWGGDVIGGVMWWIGNRGGTDYLGLFVRGFAFTWNSDQEKSLTFDWIGEKTPGGVEIGLVFGHAEF
jgi:hypothetical protein